MARKLSIYTTGPDHFVTAEVAQALGLPRFHRQAALYVAAYTKADTFRYLAELHLAPTSARTLRVAADTAAEALVAVDALPQPGAVVAVRASSTNSPAVWVSGDGHGCVQFGRFVAGVFIPDPDLIAGGGLTGNLDAVAPAVPDDASTLAEPDRRGEPHPLGCACGCDADGFTDGSHGGSPREAAEEATHTEQTFDAVEHTLARLESASQQIRRLEADLDKERHNRGRLVLGALALQIPVERIAAEMGVGPSRVYQLRDQEIAGGKARKSRGSSDDVPGV